MTRHSSAPLRNLSLVRVSCETVESRRRFADRFGLDIESLEVSTSALIAQAMASELTDSLRSRFTKLDKSGIHVLHADRAEMSLQLLRAAPRSTTKSDYVSLVHPLVPSDMATLCNAVERLCVMGSPRNRDTSVLLEHMVRSHSLEELNLRGLVC
jgi:hypothetical protein